jgi:plastocyanin
MRTLVFTAVTVLALAVAGASRPAATATKTVKITASGFSPASVTIRTGDAVKWTNADTKNHQVVANNGTFASPTLAPGRSWTHTFNTAGTFRYHDALHPSLTGRVVVTGPPPAVSIGASTPILVFGQSTHISGVISSKRAGETVTIWAQPYGQGSAAQIASLLTSTGGAWDLVVKPTLLTTYEAHWKTAVSQKVSLQMRPNILLTTGKRYWFIKVKTNHSLKGRKVYLQRLSRFQQWVKFKQVILNQGSGRLIRAPRLAHGTHTIRVFMSYNQAGAGYLDGYSRTVIFRR